MKKKLKHSIRNTFRFFLGRNGYIRFRFVMTHGYFGNFIQPLSWNEKIQHRKLFCDPNQFSNLVDKFHVRAYVTEKIGAEYLIPLIARLDNIVPVDFENLPNEFVIKTSHGGGGENVNIVSDKSKLDIPLTCSLFNSYLGKRLGKYIDELFYDIKTPSLIIEERVKNKDSSPLLDYKFHVFKNIKNTQVFMQINSNYGDVNETKTLYELTGSISNIQFSGYENGPEEFKLPDNFDEMIELAIKLSGTLEYSRVDLYNVDGKIYFGEITLCPASGWDKINKKKYDFLLGSFWGGDFSNITK